ncbi:MAG: hypothetical protein ABL308_13525 [Oceanicaulis sp.]
MKVEDGSFEQARRFLQLDHRTFGQLHSILERAVGDLCDSAPEWILSPRKKTLTFEQAYKNPIRAAIALDFVFVESDYLLVDAKCLRMPEEKQRQGRARQFLRDLYAISYDINLQTVVAYANELYGGFAWARCGGVPKAPSLVRSELLRRAERLEAMGAWSSEERDEAQALVKSTNDLLLMRAASSYRNFGGRELGLEWFAETRLGAALAWDAVWPLDNAVARKHLEICLNG